MGILEANTVKQVEMKEQIKKRISQEKEKTTRNQTIQQKSHYRDKNLGCHPSKILGNILKVDEGKTSTNGLENKKTIDDTWGLTSQRWHRIYVSRKEGGRGLASTEDRFDVSTQRLKDYIEQRKTNWCNRKQHKCWILTRRSLWHAT